MKQGKLATVGIIVMIALIFTISLSSSIFKTIEPGQAGVIFKRFAGGIDRDDIKGQGFHVIAPWNRMIVYDVRINEALEKMVVLSKNGLNITVELSYRYQPIKTKIGYLHEQVGGEYD
ncbi:MAG: SPFH domain-containing protein, partial [Bacteroidota bacterium]